MNSAIEMGRIMKCEGTPTVPSKNHCTNRFWEKKIVIISSYIDSQQRKLVMLVFLRHPESYRCHALRNNVNLCLVFV